MPPRPNLARREELLDQLEAIFLEEGFAHLRIGALASRLKCSRSTLYELADSKEALFARVVERVADRGAAEAIASAERFDTAHDRIMEVFRIAAAYQALGSDSFWRDVYGTESTAARFGESRTTAEHKVREYLEEGIASGEFRPVNVVFVARLLWIGARASREPELLAAAGLRRDAALMEFGTLLLEGVQGQTETAANRRSA